MDALCPKTRIAFSAWQDRPRIAFDCQTANDAGFGMPRHIMVATWIGGIGTAILVVLTVISFLTGKNQFADFFSIQNEHESARSSQKKIEGLQNSRTAKESAATENAIGETTLDQLLDLATPNKMAGLQAEQLTKSLDGKTVILFGYLIDSRRSFLGSSAEISSSKTGERTFYLNIGRSDKNNWAIPRGSYVGVQATLKQPLIGTMVGNNAKLLQVSKGGD